MSTLSRIWTDLKSEMSTQIQLITPNRAVDPTIIFKEFTGDSESKSIRDNEVGCRQFHIGPPSKIGYALVGGSTQRVVFSVELSFVYYNTEKWIPAAIDDLEQITAYFLNHPSSVTGVCARWCADNVIDNEELSNNRLLWRFSVVVHAEISG